VIPLPVRCPRIPGPCRPRLSECGGVPKGAAEVPKATGGVPTGQQVCGSPTAAARLRAGSAASPSGHVKDRSRSSLKALRDEPGQSAERFVDALFDAAPP
jgi:hypothetical protein